MLTFGLAACGSGGENNRDDEDTGVVGQERDANNETSDDANNDKPSNVVRDVSGTVSKPDAWEGKITVTGSLTIESAVTIAPCTTVFVAPSANIVVKDSGSIKSVGTEKCKVTIRSANDSPGSGDWGYIEIMESASQDSVFEHTNFFHGGGSGDYGALYVAGGAKVGVKNARFESIAKTGVMLDSDAKLGAFENVHFKKIEDAPLRLDINLAGQLEGITGTELGESQIVLMSGVVSSAQTWKKLSLPYVISGNITIVKPLEIEAGTTVKIAPAVVIAVKDGGAVKAIGTSESKIVFESSKSSPETGDWGYIEIMTSASQDSVFEHTNFFHGGGVGDYGTLYVAGGAKVSVKDARFESIAKTGVMLDSGSKIGAFENVHFENIEDAPLRMDINLTGQLDGITGSELGEPWIALITGEVSRAQTWKSLGLPYMISENSAITKTLELEAGTTVLMAADIRVTVRDGGSLKTHGTEDARVVIKSSKSGPGEGDWGYIEFLSSASNDSALKYTTISHGGRGGYGAIYLDSGAKIAFDNVIFEDNEVCDVDEKLGTATSKDSPAYVKCV